MTALIRCKVIRPFAFLGRIAGGGERLNLHADDFARLAAEGYVARTDDDAPPPPPPQRWAQVIER